MQNKNYKLCLSIWVLALLLISTVQSNAVILKTPSGKAAAVLSVLYAGMYGYGIHKTSNLHKENFNKLDPNFEKEVRSVLKKVGVKDWQEIPLRRIEDDFAFTSNRAMFFNQQKLPKWSLWARAERKFIIAHEAEHYKNNHVMKTLALSIINDVASIGGSKIILQKLGGFKSRKREIAAYIALNWLFSRASSLGILKYRRHKEIEADINAIQQLDTNIGALCFFSRFADERVGSSTALRDLFLSHPTDKERVREIKKHHPNSKIILFDYIRAISLW